MGKYDEDVERLHEEVAAVVPCYLDRDGDELAIIVELSTRRILRIDPVDDGWYSLTIRRVYGGGPGFLETEVGRQINGDYIPRLAVGLLATEGEP